MGWAYKLLLCEQFLPLAAVIERLAQTGGGDVERRIDLVLMRDGIEGPAGELLRLVRRSHS
jgi:hypothetical protein